MGVLSMACDVLGGFLCPNAVPALAHPHHPHHTRPFKCRSSLVNRRGKGCISPVHIMSQAPGSLLTPISRPSQVSKGDAEWEERELQNQTHWNISCHHKYTHSTHVFSQSNCLHRIPCRGLIHRLVYVAAHTTQASGRPCLALPPVSVLQSQLKSHQRPLSLPCGLYHVRASSHFLPVQRFLLNVLSAQL